jgi:tRNA 2-thiouridine synthesizing protein A
MSVQTIVTMNLTGLSCPLPIVKTAAFMKSIGSGDVIAVLATDPGSVPDFKAWSKSTGNELLEQSEEDGVFRFVLKKR